MTATAYPSQVPYDWRTRRTYLDLPFPVSEYEDRLRRIRKVMGAHDIDSLLVVGDAGDTGDLVYLSNFIPFGRAAVVVPIEDPPILITDGILHGEPINSHAWMTWIENFRPVQDATAFASTVSHALSETKSKKVGLVGSNNIPVSVWGRLEARSSVQWEDLWFEFASLKSIRSSREISLLSEVGRITAHAMREAVESVEAGKKESEIAAIANKAMMEEGAHDRAFQTIVNSGPKSGLKHSYPTERRIQRGDMVYLDLGAMKFGYRSDMSRSVVVGGANSEQKEVLDVIENAFKSLMRMMKPGVRTSRLIKKAKRLEQESRLRPKYRNRIYLGLIVHHAIATSFFEFPSLGLPDTTLQRNMSFAFEPMAHILDFGTAVIEDCILVTKDGVRSLTPYEIVHW